ncbi:class I SAM-dependent methyltransferase [bacterium]|nr:class I SAM-dependent methyltransferase [bacterium]
MKNLFDIIFLRNEHVCPWWLCFTFDNIFRKLFHNPNLILAKHIKSGDIVLDVGAGQGFFTIPMANIVGPKGKVIAMDIQSKMLEILKKKAVKYQVDDRIFPKIVSDEKLILDSSLDFALAFWMVHEVPNRQIFLQSIYDALKPNMPLLIVEPILHVTRKKLEDTIIIAQKVGFKEIDRPKISFSKSVLLLK